MESQEDMRRDVEFKTQDGVMLRAWHYLPDQRSRKVPTIGMAHGFSAVKEMYPDRFAETYGRKEGQGQSPQAGCCLKAAPAVKGELSKGLELLQHRLGGGIRLRVGRQMGSGCDE
jgi:cephalosporin-C deacetylase-like acetyl esterase